MDDDRGADLVPGGQGLVQGAPGVRTALAEQQAWQRATQKDNGVEEAAEAAEKPGRVSCLEHPSLSFQESPFPEAKACCYLFTQG